ncbi:hypothetical protein [Acidihalobacter ferrooxydans]|uniref:TM2 domain-containing protein n=1 Tax=Acidihalobacter ferrooxydans TaxID=1765967 RepID=A0A1P8UJF0_9GAMM|nr:hypothetical protein [Acidihalobacter ferrooxydans]APZ43911.1 hypothetical protein BW247_13105 [Acidihalobacter ferrooxydans]
MKKAWKQLDLDGAGLQALNAHYTQQMRRRPVAYAAMLLFPLGVHRWYLREPRGALAYLGLTAASIAGGLVFGRPGFAIPAVIELAWAMFDLYWVEQRVIALNKQLRMQQFMRPGTEPPKDYRGRYSDDEDGLDAYLKVKERERAGHQPADQSADPPQKVRPNMPSFAEQEAMLRDLTRKNKDQRKNKPK